MVDNIDALIHKAEPYLSDPQRACTQLELCGAVVQVPHYLRVLLTHVNHLLRRPRNDVLCDECEFVVNELKALMSEKSAQQEAQVVLDGVCNSIFSGDTATKCTSIVDQYLPLVWDELVALLSDAHAVCVDLEMCQNRAAADTRGRTSLVRLLPAIRRIHTDLPQRGTPLLDSRIRFLRRIQTTRGLNVGCILCKIGWTGLIDFLKDGELMDLLAMLGKMVICSKVMPPDYNEGCSDFLGTYLKPVLVMTLEEVKSTDVCAFLKLCSASDFRDLALLSSTERSSVLCEACTLMAGFLQTELSNPAIQDDITHVVEQLCNELEGDAKKECDSLLETYLPAIFQSVATELDPSVVCPELHMCPAATAPRVKIVKTEQNEDDF